MKKLIFFLLLAVTLTSCTKLIESKILAYESAISAGPTLPVNLTTSTTKYSQTGRISWWMLYTQSNYTLARADYAEWLLSDTFSNNITVADKIKEDTSIGHDNIAIKDPHTSKLLWKNLRTYPAGSLDTLSTKFWNISEKSYVFKIICTNFPPAVTAYLYDRSLGKLTQLRLDGSIQYYTIDASTAFLQDNHRFVFILKKS